MAEQRITNHDLLRRSSTKDNFKFKKRYNYELKKESGSMERQMASKSLAASDLICSQTFDSQKNILFRPNLDDVPFRYGGPSYSSFNSKFEGNS